MKTTETSQMKIPKTKKVVALNDVTDRWCLFVSVAINKLLRSTTFVNYVYIHNKCNMNSSRHAIATLVRLLMFVQYSEEIKYITIFQILFEYDKAIITVLLACFRYTIHIHLSSLLLHTNMII